MLTVDELFKLHDELCGAGKAIMESKNHDYRGGSGDPLANFRGSKTFGIEPIVGILLRVQDKLMRVKTFAEKGQLQVKGEGVKDALIDVINYMVLIGAFIKELQAFATEAAPQHKHTLLATGSGFIGGVSSAEFFKKQMERSRAETEASNRIFNTLCNIPEPLRGETPNLGDEAHPEI